MANKSQ